MVSLTIDNISINVPKNTTVLQACDSLGIDVPRFCFHERLLIAGNCRMCLVEIEKSPKPVASCALPVVEGMKVFTKTPLVRKAQEGVLEFLLLNHPLDCPICDQGGECDLQDQVMLFGSDSSRFYEAKRGVEDKDCGPLVKTIMTRCIHCTRCVRFSTEIAGVSDLGTLGRGTNTQIGTYINKILSSELSGNVIDLCPVGALTSKPYGFKGRSWELRNTNSIDISDSCGSNIIISSKGSEIMRVLPRLNENINEEWLSDKARFSYDGIAIDRLGFPLYLNQSSKKSFQIDWEKAFNIFFSSIYKSSFQLDDKFNIIFGKEVDMETILTLKYTFNKLNCFSLYSNENYCNDSSDLFYKFSSKMKNLSTNDLCIIVNSNTRFESSMLNLHLRKGVQSGNLEVGYFGPSMDLTFDINHLGLSIDSFFDLLKGKHPFSKELKKAKNPVFILNPNSFSNEELIFLNKILSENLLLSNSCLNFLNLNASETGLREVGINAINNLFFKNDYKKSINLYVGTSFKQKQLNSLRKRSKFSIYCGSHGIPEINNMDLILPSKPFSEKKASFINLEGLLQHTNQIAVGLADCREDWKIFTAFFEFMKSNNNHFAKILTTNYNDWFSLYDFFQKEYNFLWRLNNYNVPINLHFKNKRENAFFSMKYVFNSRFINFYKTSILCSISPTMQECSRIKKVNKMQNRSFATLN
jgi:NADH-quinone oxidoreductase chain G